MLETLNVKNLAVISEAEIEFGPGLNILTGETGAGKSVILGSANLALGAKASKDMIRTGADSAYVEMIFHIRLDSQKERLLDMDIELDEDRIILSRKITENKSICKINGETVSASTLKKAAEILIDIHGQHEHQKLLQSRNHLPLLDDYAGNEIEQVKKQYLAKYHEYKAVLKELESADLNDEQRTREISLLEYEINEIKNAHLTIGEDEVLEEYYKKASNSKNINEALGQVYNMASGDGMAEMISRAVREISAVTKYDDSLEEMLNQAMEIEQLTDDFARSIQSYIEVNVYDEQEFINAQTRLDEINHLKSKYGKSIDKIIETLEIKQHKYDELTDFDVWKEELAAKVTSLYEEACKLADQISAIRNAKAAELSEEVTRALKELNFLDADFKINIYKLDDIGETGRDKVEILLSTNPGESPKPLEKIASGGELSRIMLALKSVGAQKDDIETLIFDEIDTGISGRTAQAVALKLSSLSDEHQIICITHLPQIAAMADRHFCIAKSVVNDRTLSGVNLLDEEGCVKELARMMGGLEITESVIKSAREMKMLAKRSNS